MDTMEELDRLYSEQGVQGADLYCKEQRLIVSVCMACGQVYRIVASERSGGGLSHGWCSESCLTHERQMRDGDETQVAED
jgi:hypothetical protein